MPFRLKFEPGVPISEQAVYAATRAILAGHLRPGDAFPSVRSLSRELKINPNTAHKVIAALIGDGLLQAQPGIGTVVARVPAASKRARSLLLEQRVEEVVVEAKRVGVDLAMLLGAVDRHWQRMGEAHDEGDGTAEKEGTR